MINKIHVHVCTCILPVLLIEQTLKLHRLVFSSVDLLPAIDNLIGKLCNSMIAKCTPDIDIPQYMYLLWVYILKKIFDQKDFEFITTLIWYDG